MKLNDFKVPDDIDDRRGQKQPQGPIEKKMSGSVVPTRNFPEEQKKMRDGWEKAIRDKAKSPEEAEAKIKDLRKRIARQDAENEESSRDAIEAWEDGMNNPSPSLKKAYEKISKVTKKLTLPKPKLKPEGYASGGAVRGYGKARGGKPFKVC